MSRRDGSPRPDEKAKYEERYHRFKEEGHSFWPHDIFQDIVAALVILVAIILLAVFAGVPLEKLADPTNASYNPRPEWYLMAIFQLLKMFPGYLEWVAVVLVPGVIVVLLMALPFYDRGPERRPLKRPLAMAALVVGIGLFIFFTVLGYRTSPSSPKEAAYENLTTIQQVGLSTFKAQGCGSCHTITGVSGAEGVVGPDLDGIGSRLEGAFIHSFIADPKAFNPNSIMPGFLGPLSHTDIEAMTQYLLTLK